MKLKIHHTTGYHYPEKVFLEPHYLNFKPLPRPYYRIEDFSLKVEPRPSGISERVNLEDNREFQVWMNELTDRLVIRAEILLNVGEGEYSPMNFILNPAQTVSPEGFKYPEGTPSEFLSPFLETSSEYPPLNSFIRAAFEKGEGDLIAGLFELLDQIYNYWEHKRVEEESELDADDCFQTKKGSCRDLAWMMITMLRMQGLASRFVSGYAFSEEMDEGHELHAWVEVYLPGAGWTGLDPSLGLFTNEYYIPVAASFDPSYTMPVIGAYRGGVKGKMTTSLSIERLGVV